MQSSAWPIGQVLGVGAAQLHQTMAEALQQLGTERSIVVRGDDGVDEVSLEHTTQVYDVTARAH